MSFFYLSAVKGDIPAHLLETITIERLCYLETVLKQERTVYNEYLVEGSVYDNVGHFLLCIVTIMIKNFEMTNFFIKSEKCLFSQRIEALSAYDIRIFAKKLLRSINKQTETPTFIKILKVVCEHIKLKDISQHLCTAHSHRCIKHNISISFKHCLPLIARRQVELHNGLALIPCGLWKQFLTILFCTNLKYRLNNTNLDPLYTDPRLSELLIKIKSNIDSLLLKKYDHSVLLSKNVDISSKNFPPCMLNLHQQLRKRHRLTHTQRFYYSLFLKDIGMPVEEAIEFWRNEYRQNPDGHHTCGHNWDKDEKKYLYGIRHMYGLEGCKKNYTSMNCQRIQAVDCTSSEGGCPFKNFENNKMAMILNLKHTDKIYLQIKELKSRGCYTNACMKYMQYNNLNIIEKCNENSFNFTPVKYYTHCSKKVTMN